MNKLDTRQETSEYVVLAKYILNLSLVNIIQSGRNIFFEIIDSLIDERMDLSRYMDIKLQK